MASLCAFKFAAALERFAVRHDEGQLYNVLVRIDYGERRTLHESRLRASGDVEKSEFDRLSIRRHLPLPTYAIAAVAIMRREQTISVHVERSDLLVWRWRATSRLMQNRITTRDEANCETDRLAHDRTLPRTHQSF